MLAGVLRAEEMMERAGEFNGRSLVNMFARTGRKSNKQSLSSPVIGDALRSLALCRVCSTVRSTQTLLRRSRLLTQQQFVSNYVVNLHFKGENKESIAVVNFRYIRFTNWHHAMIVVVCKQISSAFCPCKTTIGIERRSLRLCQF